MSDDVLIKVDNVSKRFCRSLKRSLWYGLQDLGSEIGGRRHGGGSGLPQSSADVQLRPDEFWAVKDVSFELRRGECLGLIGRNGAGKTTLLRMLNGLIKPDTGRIEMKGRVGAMIALGAGFNPILSGRENVYINASILGMSKNEIERQLEEIIDFAELDGFIDSPVQTYSSGMQVRLGFAAATALKPDILILDEVLAVGDTEFKAKCYSRLGGILQDTAVILVTHNENQIARLSTSCMLLERGAAVKSGEPQAVISEYVLNQESGNSHQININKIHPSVNISVAHNWVDYGEQGMLIISSEHSLDNLSTVVQLTRNFEVIASSAPLPLSHSITKNQIYNYQLTFGPLYLAAGCYSLNLFIESSNRQQLLYHATSIDQINVSGFAQASPASLIRLGIN
jgi:lipopolysaccharide transport system ATP-binding protein